MNITNVLATCVALPLRATLRHSAGAHPGYFVRNIIEVTTDAGLSGWGEVGFGDQRQALSNLGERLSGVSPWDLETVKRRVLSKVHYARDVRLYGAIEMACLDIQGKATGRSVAELLGGILRASVPAAAYLFWRDVDSTPDSVADQGLELVDSLGVGTLKLKAGVADPSADADVLESIRSRCPSCRLRLDPNGSWPVHTAVRIGRRLEELELEWFEDPAAGIEGNAAVRQALRIAVATNMAPARWADLAPGVRLGACDVILGDVHYWEGIRGVRSLSDACQAFGLGLTVHSNTESGLGLAAMLQLAASLPHLPFAIDSHYHHVTADVLQEPFKYEQGAIALPPGPGLGVEVDRGKLQNGARLFAEVGDYYARGAPRWT